MRIQNKVASYTAFNQDFSPDWLILAQQWLDIADKSPKSEANQCLQCSSLFELSKTWFERRADAMPVLTHIYQAQYLDLSAIQVL